ncbi:MAG: PCMD domain-containing protein [Flavobacteriales bacterium]|nr:PCMD domain-containing protein [Flavobacteriales bacterium]
MKRFFILLLLVGMSVINVKAQKIEPIRFGDFDQWVVREIKESSLLGGKTTYVYAVAPSDSIKGAVPYTNAGGSLWGSSNVMARIMGIVKTSTTVFPEKTPEGGFCARMDTKLETCKVLGMINITVLASGSIFLGYALEPIHSANNPYSKINMGVPFTKKPKALRYDYKAIVSQDTLLTKATGCGSSLIPGRDMAEVYVYLQKRWENADGSIHAKRIATSRERIANSTNGWVRAHRAEIHYGDIRSKSFYHSYMGLMKGNSFYAMNSKGKMVPIVEEGWGNENDTPTHVVMMFSSGCIGAYVGALGNSLWVDNVGFEY